MGFFDYFTGKHDPNDGEEAAQKKKRGLETKPLENKGNVENLDDEILKDLQKGKR